MICAVVREDCFDHAEEIGLQFFGKAWNGQPRDDVFDLLDSAIGEDGGEIAYVVFDDLEMREVLKSVTEDPSEIGIALDDDHTARFGGSVGDRAGDRPRTGAEFDDGLNPRPIDPPDRRSRKPPARRRQTRDLGSVTKEFSDKQKMICHTQFVERMLNLWKRPGLSLLDGRTEEAEVSFVAFGFEEASRFESGGDRFQLIAEEQGDEVIDEPRLLDLGRVAAFGDDDLARSDHSVDGADRSFHIGDHLIFGSPYKK